MDDTRTDSQNDAPVENAPVTQAQTNSSNATSDSGLDDNLGGAISYIPVIGLIFIFIEKKSKFIRFHAFQSVFYTVAWILVTAVLGVIPILGWIMLPFVNLALLIYWFFAIYQAFQNKMYKMPLLGDLAEQQVNK